MPVQTHQPHGTGTAIGADSPQPTDLNLDLGNFEALTGGDPQLSRRLLEELLSSSQHDRQELTALIEAHAPLQEIVEQAHKIKGAARIVQAAPLAGSVKRLNRRALGEMNGCRLKQV